MPLALGTHLGVYEITAILGAGGMGEVYRARDTKLGRDVAIKVVLDAFVSDRDRTARFEREARALAALNHPNIAALYGMEQDGGRHFLVMELVEGETLADRIHRNRDGLPIEEALEIGRQIADAIEAAHEKGIVHRDLKPANVKLTPDDKVKVLDFGLAKAAGPEGASPASLMNSPTVSVMGTNAGVILGTASYMSPEQARGYAADHRSDVFSFGVVLYEMLTGRRPFQGETVSDVIAAVLARDPDLAALPAGATPRLAELLARCLEKNPRKRWQAMGDVRHEIETIAAHPRAAAVTPGLAAAPPPRALWRRALPFVVTAAVVALLVSIPAWLARPAQAPSPVVRFSFPLGNGQAIAGFGRNALAISPDGSRIAYIATRQIFVRPMAETKERMVFENVNLEAVYNLVFSPDGESIAFWIAGAIKRMAAGGGPLLTVCSMGNSPGGLTWSGNWIYFSTGRQIMRVAAGGGTPEVLVQLADGESAFKPQLLPDGRTVLYTLASGSGLDRWEQARIVAQRLGEEARTTLVEGGADARFVPTGHIVYAQRGVLFAVAFNPISLTVSGVPVPVLEGVRRGTGEIGASTAQFDVSASGTLTYLAGPVMASAVTQLSLALFDRSGGMQPVKIPPGPYSEPRMSPDGRSLAFDRDDGRDMSVWVYDVKGGSARRLTFGGRNRYPVWSADSTRLTFQSDRDGDASIYWQRADGTGVAERLTKAEPGVSHVPQSWSPDGSVLLFDAARGEDVTLMALKARDRSIAQFGGVRSLAPSGAIFSPDGHWVAYSTRANLSSANVVYVQPFPATGALFQISRTSEDGHHQVWSRDGKELFYTPGPGAFLIGVPVAVSPTFTTGDPANVPRPFANQAPQVPRPFDTAPQGHFLGLTGNARTDSAAGEGQIHIVINWLQELSKTVH